MKRFACSQANDVVLLGRTQPTGMNPKNLTGAFVLAVCCLLASTEPAQTTPSGLIHAWNCDTNANDSVGTNNAILNNVSFAVGHLNQALVFDGTGWADFGPELAVFGQNDFTISFWIQTTNADTETV